MSVSYIWVYHIWLILVIIIISVIMYIYTLYDYTILFIYICIDFYQDKANSAVHLWLPPLGGDQRHRRERVSFGRAGRGERSPAVTRLDLTMVQWWSPSGKTVPYTKKNSDCDTLWWTYKKLLKMAIEIVDFPINSMVIFHCYDCDVFIWVNLITTSLFDRTLESWFVREIIPFMALIQVGELL